ncbi:hypothetical protein B0H19DRAFT_1303697 [Mycena capillaripes]|nr:hypothetical protein B0H19DRAFT_1303697 [Mycena capillaripes]
MSILSFSSTAGPSPTTLRALSDYCASSDSSDDSFSHTDSSYSFHSDVAPVSSPKVFPELPDIIVQSDRFQSTSVQQKMLKEHLVRFHPSGAIDQEISCSFNSGSNAFADTLSSRLRLSPPTSSSSPPATPPRTSPTSQTPPAYDRGSSSGYPALGYGLPSQFSNSSASSRFMSGFTFSSVRSISTVLSMVSSGSYPRTIFGALPKLTRHSRLEPQPHTGTQNMGPIARLRAETANFVRERLRRVSIFHVAMSDVPVLRGEIAANTLKVTRDGMSLKKTLAAVARFIVRR